MIRLLVLASLLLVVTAESANAQNLEEIYKRDDKRTYLERAYRLYQAGGQDSLAVTMLKKWLYVVPKDTIATGLLIDLYRRLGDTVGVTHAQLIHNAVNKKYDPRVVDERTLQVRMGHYKVLLPKRYSHQNTYPAILILHGNGNNPDIMLNWAKTLELDSVIFIAPEAPYIRLVESFAMHWERYSASGDGLGIPDSLMPSVVDASGAWYHDAFLDAATKYPIDTGRHTVLGFSQGGFYSYVVGTRYTASFKNLISICASMYDYGRVEENIQNLHANGVHVLTTHGTKDKTVPFSTGEKIYGWLTAQGVHSQFKPFDGGHWPSKEITKEIHDWFLARQNQP